VDHKKFLLATGGIFLLLVLRFLALAQGASREAKPAFFELNAGGFGVESASSWPAYLAQQKGFFAKEGLKVTFTRSYEQMPGLIAGSFDVIAEAADTPILAASKGAELLVVYDISHRPSQFMVLGPGVNSAAQ